MYEGPKEKDIKTQFKIYCQYINPLSFFIIPKASPNKSDVENVELSKKAYYIISRNYVNLGCYKCVSQSFNLKRKTETKQQRKTKLTWHLPLN